MFLRGAVCLDDSWRVAKYGTKLPSETATLFRPPEMSPDRMMMLNRQTRTWVLPPDVQERSMIAPSLQESPTSITFSAVYNALNATTDTSLVFGAPLSIGYVTTITDTLEGYVPIDTFYILSSWDDINNPTYCTLDLACIPIDTTITYLDSVCIGEPFEGYGFTVQAQNTAGVYTFTRTECTDTASILHELTLTVHPEMHTTLIEYISPDESVYHDGVAYSSPGDYTFTYTSSNGCDSVVELHILYHPDEIPQLTVWLPNAFMPNKPTLNNVFRPVFNYPEEIESYSMEIYNRWGGLVFRTEELSFGWDGANAPEGVYTCVVCYRQFGGKKKTITGSVTLLR